MGGRQTGLRAERREGGTRLDPLEGRRPITFGNHIADPRVFLIPFTIVPPGLCFSRVSLFLPLSCVGVKSLRSDLQASFPETELIWLWSVTSTPYW